ncbi:DUF883 family protein [Nitrosomonas eutropha]|uniref:ElaB/YqjD/DUF883 family membrane-anchored ribosome-binding protein n=2 Tax=Nitrosomonas eutropha TaxID=916 RepID=A0ABX5M380_9PROT|nr:DUF883 family protein [Nitrosomonas eutropha]ABI60568.1 uncharacterized conserved protein, ElaB family protein [Nitrosomonas eutropha C91]PXV73288.1 ElaB/YqjD/DUF883 family membrane-anchored ribosome-binding protein [Nitrosomonas eutropha]SCX22384.1 Membrane-anchored ribosome-binding protein, inhibits growth in stationary phase, ElaB/YqjD/DUF883 family [Nitrosomonas eutropha]
MCPQNNISDTVDKVTDKVSKSIDQASEELSKKGEQLKNMEEQLMDNIVDYTKKNPLTSVGIALGVGFVLSRVFNNNYR